MLPRLPDNRTLLVYGGLALAAGVGVYVLVKKAPAIASAAGYSVGSLAPNAAGGIVRGLGSGLGLPDTADPVVVSDGRSALRAGDWLTASLKLPAPEFLSAVWSRLTGGPGIPTPGQPMPLGGPQSYITVGQNATTSETAGASVKPGSTFTVGGQSFTAGYY